MPAPISRLPTGLLDMLLVQQQGENPRTLSTALQPSLDMNELYMSDRLDVDGNSFVVGAINAIGNVEVPASEIWYMRSMGIRGSFNTAGQSFTCGIQLRNLDQTLIANIGSTGPLVSTSTTDRYNWGLFFPQPFFLRAGLNISAQVSQLDLDGGSNLVPEFTLVFNRFNI